MARKQWLDEENTGALPAAFMRRPIPKDEGGLSADVESARSCYKALNKCFGVVSLHLGRLRDLQLDILVDTPPHANIIGLPRQEDDRTKAERLASLLAQQARLVPSEQYLDSA